MKIQLRITIICLAMLVSAGLSATIIYVDDDATSDPGPGDPSVSDPSENGSSSHPYDAIQEGLDAATTGVDTVLVINGTYTGTGNKNLDFGGKAINLRSLNGAENTVIDCEGTGRGFYFYSGEGLGSVIDGFTITGGSGADGAAIRCQGSSPTIMNCWIMENMATENGGGIYCSGSAPSIEDCIITDNTAADLGGGMTFLGDSDPTVTRCTIHNNTADMGGGFYWFDSDPALTDCTVSSNNAIAGGGGGIFCYNSDSDITGCTITDNRSDGSAGGGIVSWYHTGTIANCTIVGNTAYWGAGIESRSSTGVISNCVIARNTAGDSGGGIYLIISSAPQIVNCTITENSAPNGGGIYSSNSSGTTITNCILWGDAAEEVYVNSGGDPTITYSDVEGGWPGTGNLDADPCFVYPRAAKYRLKPGSPCIDSATSAAPATASDMEGRPRWDDSIRPNTGAGATTYFDMGAYEFKGFYVDELCGSNAWSGLRPRWNGTDGPKRTIQAGIDAAGDGDLVCVAPGYYAGYPNYDLSFGGKSITLMSREGASSTTINADGNGRVFNLSSGESEMAIVLGFTMTKGASPSGEHFGGCVLCYNSNPSILACKIMSGSSEYGGGIACENGSSPLIMDCEIAYNSAVTYGGGIECHFGSPTIDNCLIYGNTAGNSSGGIDLWLTSHATIVNCTITSNEAGYSNGGVLAYGSGATIRDCILWGNDLEQFSSTSTIDDLTYCDVENGTGESWFGTGCIDSDPEFVSGPLHDYCLSQTAAGQATNSPCLDTGSDTAESLRIDSQSTRTDGLPDSGTVDIGYHAQDYVLLIDSITRSGGDVTIHWNALPGVSYTVQYADDVPSWSDVSVGVTDNWTDVGGASSSHRYYRVVKE